MQIAQLIENYGERLQQKYPNRLLPSHRHALDAMTACRNSCGEILAHCEHCSHQQIFPLSCGHRSCPACQNHDTTTWLDRQLNKLLPVPYFMVTFTLPSELRDIAWQHQSDVYSLMFKAATATLKELGLDPKRLGVELGMTGVLHTHTRRLDYHPHIHFIVPGGGIDSSGEEKKWRSVKGKYLFKGEVIAKMFRGKMMYELIAAEINLPIALPKKWIVDCDYAGKGKSALQYLSRYLYRGVISQNNIISDRDGKVTFSYVESKTNKTKTRTLNGEDFLWLVVQHVLPRGFRRVRDYGFLHANAKKGLALVQLILVAKLTEPKPRTKRSLLCRICQCPMVIVQIIRHKILCNPVFRKPEKLCNAT